MTIDPTVLPGLLFLILELAALAAVGFVVARTALREDDDLAALAQGLVIGPALWGLAVNFILRVAPGLAGAIVGWALILAIGAGLAWRSPGRLRVPPRRLAGFAGAALAVFWVTLAARQLMKVPDPEIHLGLAAYIRDGGWPPIVFWNPDFDLYYHHGVDVLVALLAPPWGPNPAFTIELLGAYLWTSFALVVTTAILNRGGWFSTLTLSPLLLTAGAWTLVGTVESHIPNILQVPVPAGVPAAGLRSSLAGLMWPEPPPSWPSEFSGAPANIWKPPFVLAYALAFIVLRHVTASGRRSRMTAPTLAALVGFLGIVSSEIALLTLGLWVVLDTARIVSLPMDRRTARAGLLSAAAGPGAALLLLAICGSVLTGILADAPRAELSLRWITDPWSRQTLGRFDLLPGGLGLLGVGAMSTAAIAVLLARRDRLVLALAAGSVPLMIGALTIQFERFQFDVTRLDGHARNFALLALLLALASRLPTLRRRWRIGACVLIAALAVWPTIAAPARTIAQGVSRGVHLTNAEPGVRDTDSDPYRYDLRRFVIETAVSDRVTRYIRNHIPVDARIFSPHPSEMTNVTGRLNASGLEGHLHIKYLKSLTGPGYDDVARYLEPGAVRRLGFSYVHATNDWIDSLPARAQRRLKDQRFFEPLARSDTDTLYRIRPAFLSLDEPPNPESFEVLRRAIPSSATVYLAPGLEPMASLRRAVALSHTQLLGSVEPGAIHLITDFSTEPLGTQTPDFVAAPARLAPSAMPGDARQPVWWNREFAVYSSDGSAAPVTPPPPRDFSIQLTDMHMSDQHIAFTATFTDRASDQWQGQDWVVVATDDSPWNFPYRFNTASFTSAFVRWFDGQVQPIPETTTHEYVHRYEFDPRTGALAVWDGNDYTSLGDPQPALGPGDWLLAARPNISGRKVGLIPVLQFTITGDGKVTHTAYQGSLDAMLVP